MAADVAAAYLAPVQREAKDKASAAKGEALAEDCGRTAFLAGAILRDATARFRLSDTSRMTRQRNQIHGGARIDQRIRVCSRHCLRAMGTRLDGSDTLGIMRGHLRPLRHVRHAVMLAVSPAARRQTSLCIQPHRKEWGDERKANSSQQQDGQKSTQCFD